MLTKITHFSGILLSHIPLFGQKWYKQLRTKRPSFQNYPHTEKWCFNLKGLLWHVSLPGANESKKNEKRTKEKMIVTSCTWKIWLSLNKNQEAKKCWENDEKELYKHKSFFSYKELLFSLGNYIWDEKWPSFTIPSLM